MTQSSADWPQLVTQAIRSGRYNASVAHNLDAVLLWVAGQERDGAQSIERALGDTDDRSTLRLRALQMLDGHLFTQTADPFRVLGLNSKAAKSDIRRRYQRLVRVFHPDKGLGDTNWLSDRTEKLNTAYQAASQPGAGAAAQASAVAAPPTHVAAATAPRRRRVSTQPSARTAFSMWVLKTFGSGRSAKSMLLAIGVVLVGVYLTLLLISS